MMAYSERDGPRHRLLFRLPVLHAGNPVPILPAVGDREALQSADRGRFPNSRDWRSEPNIRPGNRLQRLEPVGPPRCGDHGARPLGRHRERRCCSLLWRRQAAALDKARANVSAMDGGQPSAVVFTASATEANDLALQGFAQAASSARPVIAISAVEHASVHANQACHASALPVWPASRAGGRYAESGMPTAIFNAILDSLVEVSPILLVAFAVYVFMEFRALKREIREGLARQGRATGQRRSRAERAGSRSAVRCGRWPAGERASPAGQV